MSRNLHAMLLKLSVLASLLLGALTAHAEPLQVTVFLSDEAEVYREFEQHFMQQVSAADISVSTLSDAPPAKADLIVAVGAKAAALALKSDADVLAVLVSKAAVDKLSRGLESRAGHRGFSAIYMDQPAQRQVELIKALLPEVKSIGLMHSPEFSDATGIRRAVAASRMALHEQQVDSADTLYRDLQELLQSSEVLLAVPDSRLYNSTTIRNILLATYRQEVPLVGFSPSYVKAGALCAVFSTPEHFAAQAAQATALFALSRQLPPTRYPTRFEVKVNQQVARSLRIQPKNRVCWLKRSSVP